MSLMVALLSRERQKSDEMRRLVQVYGRKALLLRRTGGCGTIGLGGGVYDTGREPTALRLLASLIGLHTVTSRESPTYGPMTVKTVKPAQ